MRLRDMNWQAVAEYLTHDDQVVVPIGSTEQHRSLSTRTDSNLEPAVAVDAASALGFPVLPVLPLGSAPDGRVAPPW